MGIAEILLLGIGLSMDAFAVAVCKGLGMRRVDYVHALVIALFFGVFQAAMPLLGWLLGSRLSAFVDPVGHWVAFALLAAVGAKMLYDAWRDDGQDRPGSSVIDVRELLVLALATSIDALAVGVSFAFLEVHVPSAAALIGCTTFVLSLLGVVVGSRFGARYERRASAVGGIVLICIGLKILLDHFGLFVS